MIPATPNPSALAEVEARLMAAVEEREVSARRTSDEAGAPR
jgi:hypothetical protein